MSRTKFSDSETKAVLAITVLPIAAPVLIWIFSSYQALITFLIACGLYLLAFIVCAVIFGKD